MADTYVQIGKIDASGKVDGDYAKSAGEGVRKALETWLRRTTGFTNARSTKGYHVSATVQSLDIDMNGSSATIKSKVEIRVAHLPQVVRPRAVLDAGATVQGSARRIEKEIAYCTEAVTESIAKGKMEAYMKASKSKL